MKTKDLSIAVVGESRVVDFCKAPVVRLSRFHPLLWGRPSTRELAALLLRAVGESSLEMVSGRLSALLSGLQQTPPFDFSLLPTILRNPKERHQLAGRIADPSLRRAWLEADFTPPNRWDSLASRLDRLFGAGLAHITDAPLMPEASQYYLLRPPASRVVARLQQALFVTCFGAATARARAAPPLLVIRIQPFCGEARDEPLLYALERFRGDLIVTVDDIDRVARPLREWLFERERAVRPSPSAIGAETSNRGAAVSGHSPAVITESTSLLTSKSMTVVVDSKRAGTLRVDMRESPPKRSAIPPCDAHNPASAVIDRPHSSTSISVPARPTYSSATTRERLQLGWCVVADRAGGCGIDGVTVENFQNDLYGQLFFLGTDLTAGTYVPMPLLRVYAQKSNGEPRPIGVPTVRDRVLQSAVLLTLDPIFEPTFLDCSYGYRPNRNAHQAVAEAELHRHRGYGWVVTADIRKCFDSLDHEILFARLRERIDDPALLDLIQSWMRLPVVEGGVTGPPNEKGVPQGAPISPLLANIYLHALDVFMTARGRPWVRYADDFLCFARTRQDAEDALIEIRDFVETKLKLALKPGRTDISSFAAGFEFLGFWMRDDGKAITGNRLEEFKKRVRRTIGRQHISARTRLRKINDRITGFGAYYRTGEPRTTEQLRWLDTWCQAMVRRWLVLPPGESLKLRSTLAVSSKPQSWSRDFYTNVFVEDVYPTAAEAVGDSTPINAATGTATETEKETAAARFGYAVAGAERPVRHLPEHRPLTGIPADGGGPRLEALQQLARESRTDGMPPLSDYSVAADVAQAAGVEQPEAPENARLPPSDPQALSTNLAAPPAVMIGPPEEVARVSRQFLAEGNPKAELREFLRLGRQESLPTRSQDGDFHVGMHGVSLVIRSKHLVVRKDGADVAQASVLDIKRITIQGVSIMVTTPLLRELGRRSIPIHFLDWKGTPWGMFGALGAESPSILRGQLRAFEGKQGVAIAREMLIAKGKNQAQLLRLYARYRSKHAPAVARNLTAAIRLMERNVAIFDEIDGERVDDIRGQLVAVEGRIAAAHFRAIGVLVGPERGFTVRQRRIDGRDAVNQLLDFCYAMLYTRCHQALIEAGLDARLGFVHTDGPGGKLSLLYDFVEEFRALGADRPALALLVRGARLTRTKNDRFTIPTRRRMVRAFQKNLESRCRYRGARRMLGEIITAQAQHLADVLGKAKGKSRVYRGFRYNH